MGVAIWGHKVGRLAQRIADPPQTSQVADSGMHQEWEEALEELSRNIGIADSRVGLFDRYIKGFSKPE